MKYLGRFLARVAEGETGPKNLTDTPSRAPTKLTKPPEEGVRNFGVHPLHGTDKTDETSGDRPVNLGRPSTEAPTKLTKPPELGDGRGFVGFVSARGEDSSTFSPARLTSRAVPLVGIPPPSWSELEALCWGPALDDPGSALSVFLPPSGTDPGDAPWQAKLKFWPQVLRDAWDEKAGVLEFDGGLDRDIAERLAFEMIAGRPAIDPWDDEMRTDPRREGFRMVDPAELDDHVPVPTPDDVALAQPWTCQNPFCRHKGRWWLSPLGVLNCANCVPPAFPELVVAAGDAETAPARSSRLSGKSRPGTS